MAPALPPEIVERISSLNAQQRQLLSIINDLTSPTKVPDQLALDELAARVRYQLTKTERDIEVCYILKACFLRGPGTWHSDQD